MAKQVIRATHRMRRTWRWLFLEWHIDSDEQMLWCPLLMAQVMPQSVQTVYRTRLEQKERAGYQDLGLIDVRVEWDADLC